MVLKITQQTFDDAVKENIEDLGLEPEEALSEAIKQFESQGVDLSQIQKCLRSDQPQPTVIQNACGTLKDLHESNNSDPNKYIEPLRVIKEECDKGIDYKIFAAVAGAYNIIFETLDRFPDNKDLLKHSLRCLVSLMTKQPDLLTDQGARFILTHLGQENDSEILKLTLKWTKECCIMHEMNRQNLFAAGIVNKLKVLLEGNSTTDIFRDILGVFRALILDDDIRVEFGHAHEHAKSIASDTLLSIIGLMTRYKTDEALICDLLLTLSALLVRSEFCKQIEDAGGLELIHDIMASFIDSEKINRQCFKVIKALAGNDQCKSHIIQRGLAPVIVNSFARHKANVQTAGSALLAVSALTLRSPDNSKALFEAGLPEVIVDALKLHPEDKSVQKNGSWAVRNMVSRSRYQNSRFIELGVEEIFQNDLKKFKNFEYDFKAALRDLECDVQLREEWTGRGGMLTSEQVNNK